MASSFRVIPLLMSHRLTCKLGYYLELHRSTLKFVFHLLIARQTRISMSPLSEVNDSEVMGLCIENLYCKSMRENIVFCKGVRWEQLIKSKFNLKFS